MLAADRRNEASPTSRTRAAPAIGPTSAHTALHLIGSSHTTKVRCALTAGIPSLSAQEPSRRADTSCPPDHHVDGRRARRCRCGVALGDTPSPAQGALLERKQPASVALFDVLRRKVRAWENTYTN